MVSQMNEAKKAVAVPETSLAFKPFAEVANNSSVNILQALEQKLLQNDIAL